MSITHHCRRRICLPFLLAFLLLGTLCIPSISYAFPPGDFDGYVRVKNTNEPRFRLNPNGVANWGVTAHTTDGFFVRNVRAGVRPLQISESAFDNQMVLTEFGFGIGTNDPLAALHINGTPFSTKAGWVPGIIVDVPGTPTCQLSFLGGDGNDLEFSKNGGATGMTFNGEDLAVGGKGEPATNFEVRSPNNLVYSRLNAGDSIFTVSSSRTLKENIKPVKFEVLDKMTRVPVMTYDWKKETLSGQKTQRTGKIGLIAEDFHTILQRGSDKEINGREVQMVLWRAVQELQARNKKLQTEQKEQTAALERLRETNAALQERIAQSDSKLEFRLREIERRLVDAQ